MYLCFFVSVIICYAEFELQGISRIQSLESRAAYWNQVRYPIFQIQLYVGRFGIFKFASFTVVIYLKIKILSM